MAEYGAGCDERSDASASADAGMKLLAFIARRKAAECWPCLLASEHTFSIFPPSSGRPSLQASARKSAEQRKRLSLPSARRRRMHLRFCVGLGEFRRAAKGRRDETNETHSE